MDRPKKSLGQNFLEDKKIAEKIVKAADLKSDDIVIEIGPGKGILTAELAKYAKKVIAIEIDKGLVDYLKKKFSGQKNIEIINDDILKINLSKLQNSFLSFPRRRESRELFKASDFIPASPAGRLDSRLRGNDMEVSDISQSMKHTHHDYKLVANLPYYITSPIIRLFLETECPPRKMILTVQKEVAKRITAPPGKMSKLSVSVQYYAKPEILFYINKKSFNPVPKVDSAVIRITYNLQPTTYNKENENLPLCPPARLAKAKAERAGEAGKRWRMRAGTAFAGDLKASKSNEPSKNNKAKKEESKEFFRIVQAGFCARRKTLVNNLSNSLQLGKKEVQKKLKAAGILPAARAQELSVKDWERLSDLI